MGPKKLNKLSRQYLWFILAFTILIADQGIKTYIARTTPLGWNHGVTDFFNLVHVLNPGAAFSFLAAAGGWQRWFFIGFAFIISIWLGRMLTKPQPVWDALAFSTILGGALGNATDRAFRGSVIDYLDFHWQGWHWPAFNLADTAIVAGAVAMAFGTLLGGRQAKQRA